MLKNKFAVFDKKIMLRAVKDSFLKLNPVIQLKNPVMFVVFTCSIFTSIIFCKDWLQGQFNPFTLQISLWLWFTVLFANFAEAIAEGRGKTKVNHYGN